VVVLLDFYSEEIVNDFPNIFHSESNYPVEFIRILYFIRNPYLDNY